MKGAEYSKFLRYAFDRDAGDAMNDESSTVKKKLNEAEALHKLKLLSQQTEGEKNRTLGQALGFVPDYQYLC